MTWNKPYIKTKNTGRIVHLILLFTFLAGNLYAQGEEAPADVETKKREIIRGQVVNPDTITSDTSLLTKKKTGEQELEHSASKAMIYSIILPGAGQFYNKKYWKIPIVYAVLGTVVYVVQYNTKQYRIASENYAADQSDTNEWYLQAWRRNVELSYISLVASHALQVLDAYVDANLFYWDVDPDLTIRLQPSIEPVLMPTNLPVSNYGFKLNMTF